MRAAIRFSCWAVIALFSVTMAGRTLAQDAALQVAYAAMTERVLRDDKPGILQSAQVVGDLAAADPGLPVADRATLLAQLGDAVAAAGSLPQAAEYFGQCVSLRGARPDPAALQCLRKQRDALAAMPGPIPDSRDRARATAEAVAAAAARLYGAGSPLLAPDYLAAARLAEAAGDAPAALAARQRAELAAAGPRAERTRGLDGEPAPGAFTQVRVFYGTNRARTGRVEPDAFYGPGRGELELGSVEVSIPRTHRYTLLEAPSMTGFDLHANPDRHVLLLSVHPAEPAAFMAGLRDASRVGRRHKAFVFVHGYNVTFEDAARRAAQLAYDVGFEGAPILYSWPSAGNTLGYFVDEANVSASAAKLHRFLGLVRTALRDADPAGPETAERLHLLAHSMGSRALLPALQQAAWTGEPPFEEVVFAAPDIDADLFTEAAPDLARMARRVTLYASDNDVALNMSSRLHGGFGRAGQGGPQLLGVAGVDSVDLSAVPADLLHHSYFGSGSAAVLDLLTLLWRGTPPAGRCGLESLSGARWLLRTNACEEPDRLAAAILVRRFGQNALAQARLAASQGMLEGFIREYLGSAERGSTAAPPKSRLGPP